MKYKRVLLPAFALSLGVASCAKSPTELSDITEESFRDIAKTPSTEYLQNAMQYALTADSLVKLAAEEHEAGRYKRAFELWTQAANQEQAFSQELVNLELKAAYWNDEVSGEKESYQAYQNNRLIGDSLKDSFSMNAAWQFLEPEERLYSVKVENNGSINVNELIMGAEGGAQHSDSEVPVEVTTRYVSGQKMTFLPDGNRTKTEEIIYLRINSSPKNPWPLSRATQRINKMTK